LPIPGINEWEKNWPTVTKSDATYGNCPPESYLIHRKKARETKGYRRQFPLGVAVMFAAQNSWPKSIAEDPLGIDTGPRSFPTPTATERSGINPKTGKGGGLSRAVKENWPTPCAREARNGYQVRTSKSGNCSQRGLTTIAVDESGGPEKSTKLNPRWVEWLMGWPIGWTDIDPLPPENVATWLKGMSEGWWWDRDPHDHPDFPISRTTPGHTLRGDQLQCLGNGQVPAQLVLAEHLLSKLKNSS